MMRRLLLMRHAKSSWDDQSLSDHQRPLNKRGRRDAPVMAAWLIELGWVPERVISSDSQRTKDTWALMQELLPQAVVRFCREFYLGDLGDMAEQLKEIPPDVTTVMLLGHNPGWEDALCQLAGVEDNMTTANVALLESEVASWDQAAVVKWTLVKLLRPKGRRDTQ